MDREELAWAAGFFDGEGCTNAHRSNVGNKPWRISVSVTQIHRDTLERFQAALGGIGTIYGPYEKPVNPQFTFKGAGLEKTQAIIAMLWPWLTPHKKEQAILAISRARSTARPAARSPEQAAEAHRAANRAWARRKREKASSTL